MLQSGTLYKHPVMVVAAGSWGEWSMSGSREKCCGFLRHEDFRDPDCG